MFIFVVRYKTSTWQTVQFDDIFDAIDFVELLNNSNIVSFMNSVKIG